MVNGLLTFLHVTADVRPPGSLSSPPRLGWVNSLWRRHSAFRAGGGGASSARSSCTFCCWPPWARGGLGTSLVSFCGMSTSSCRTCCSLDRLAIGCRLKSRPDGLLISKSFLEERSRVAADHPRTDYLRVAFPAERTVRGLRRLAGLGRICFRTRKSPRVRGRSRHAAAAGGPSGPGRSAAICRRTLPRADRSLVARHDRRTDSIRKTVSAWVSAWPWRRRPASKDRFTLNSTVPPIDGPAAASRGL